MSAILLVKSKKGLALDIGAYRGRSAIKISRLKPHFNIISFEPNRKCHFALKMVRVILGRRFRFEPVGLSDHAGEATYYEPYLNALGVGAEGTFSPDNLDAEMEQRLGKQYQVKKTLFPIARLDDLNLSPDFVKIDVQGLEMNVLRGARETIIKSHPVFLIERNSHNEREVSDYFAVLGYRKMDEKGLRKNGVSFRDSSGDDVFVYGSTAVS